MNKPCLKCGKILLVPDIPLPKTYTQRCIACGFDNPVGDDLFFDSDAGNVEEDLDFLQFEEVGSGDILAGSGGLNRDNADRFLQQMNRRPEPTVPSPGSSAPTVRGQSAYAAPPSQAGVPGAMTPRPGASTPTSQDLEQALNRLRGEFDQKCKELEARLSAQTSRELASLGTGALPSPPAAAPSEKGSMAAMVRELVAENETLFCTQNTALIKACEVALRQKGFTVTAAATVEEAQSRIQEFAYQVIIFDYRFVQASQEGQNLLASIRNITLPVRRHQSVVLITPGLPTCESQVFYQLGVDLNISPDDLSALGVLVRELVDHKMALLEPYLTSSLDTDRLMM